MEDLIIKITIIIKVIILIIMMIIIKIIIIKNINSLAFLDCNSVYI